MLIDLIRSQAWGGMPDCVVEQSVPSMLSITERKMLCWLAAHVQVFDGCIVDAGAFVGGSTFALATGLKKNPSFDGKRRLVVYDKFIVPNEPVTLGYLPGYRPGDSVLGLFDSNIKQFSDLLDVRRGDFLRRRAPKENICLCFIDIAKTWELNDAVVAKLFPLLVPGLSVVVQQDYNDHSCPWVNMTMARFRDHFEWLCDDNGSRVFIYTRRIPIDDLQRPLRKFSDAEKMNSSESGD